METGNVVYSKSGHDIGEAYMVIGIDDKNGYLILADGKRRPLENPKVKNPKHLRYIGESLPEAKQKLEQGNLLDSDLVWFLKPYRK